MRIGILEAGRLPEDMSDIHGAYSDMFEAVLGRLDEALSFATYAALEHHLPAGPEECDAYIVTGSASGVYERLDWMVDLQAFLKTAHGAGRRILGICFGHQLLADLFGGEVSKVDKGWGIGLHDYRVHHEMPWMTGGREAYRVFASHQDQVVAPPPGARVLAGSDFCPNGMLEIDGNILTMQCHPEMGHPFAHDLLESRRERIGPDLVDRAQSTLGQPCDRMEVSGWIVNFLRGGHGAGPA